MEHRRPRSTRRVVHSHMLLTRAVVLLNGAREGTMDSNPTRRQRHT